MRLITFPLLTFLLIRCLQNLLPRKGKAISMWVACTKQRQGNTKTGFTKVGGVDCRWRGRMRPGRWAGTRTGQPLPDFIPWDRWWGVTEKFSAGESGDQSWALKDHSSCFIKDGGDQDCSQKTSWEAVAIVGRRQEVKLGWWHNRGGGTLRFERP